MKILRISSERLYPAHPVLTRQVNTGSIPSLIPITDYRDNWLYVFVCLDTGFSGSDTREGIHTRVCQWKVSSGGRSSWEDHTCRATQYVLFCYNNLLLFIRTWCGLAFIGSCPVSSCILDSDVFRDKNFETSSVRSGMLIEYWMLSNASVNNRTAIEYNVLWSKIQYDVCMVMIMIFFT